MKSGNDLLVAVAEEVRAAPRVLTTATLSRLVEIHRPGAGKQLLHKTIEFLARMDILSPVRRGIYLNVTARPRPSEAEAARHVRRGAVVSLHTVLGECGILNNPPRDVWAVLPDMAGTKVDESTHPNPASGFVPGSSTSHRGFEFRSIRHDTLFAPDRKDLLDPKFAYPRATAEAALAHWIYLSEAQGKNRGIARHPMALPASHDLDMDTVNDGRLLRIAATMGIGEATDAFLRGLDPDDEEKVSIHGF